MTIGQRFLAFLSVKLDSRPSNIEYPQTWWLWSKLVPRWFRGKPYRLVKKESAMSENDIERLRLREALQEVCNVLGSGACMMVQCEGCSFEMTEASSIAHEALGEEFPPKADHHAHFQRLQQQARDEMLEKMACGHAKANLVTKDTPDSFSLVKLRDVCVFCEELAKAVHDENRRAHEEILDVLKRLDSPSLKGAIPDKVRQLLAQARREQMEENSKADCLFCRGECEGVNPTAEPDGQGSWQHRYKDGGTGLCSGYKIRARFEEKNRLKTVGEVSLRLLDKIIDEAQEGNDG